MKVTTVRVAGTALLVAAGVVLACDPPMLQPDLSEFESSQSDSLEAIPPFGQHTDPV